MALVRRQLVEKLRLAPACYASQRWFKGTSDSQAGDRVPILPHFDIKCFQTAQPKLLLLEHIPLTPLSSGMPKFHGRSLSDAIKLSSRILNLVPTLLPRYHPRFTSSLP